MSWAIWIAGRPGSGKSVIARAAAAALEAEHGPIVVLELDDLGRVLTPTPTHSDVEQELIYRGLVWIAMTLTESGIPVIIDAAGQRRAWRDLARTSITTFAEVQLHCPLEVCREREAARAGGSPPRGIAARAGQPEAPAHGEDVPYEPAVAPELDIDTTALSVRAAAERVAALAHSLRPAVAPPPRGAGAPWAIWITGLPGSGKTTIAFGAARTLTAQGVPVRVLSRHEACHYVLCGVHAVAGADELFHRALVYAAKRLTDEGVPVIIDATAPRRSWRDLARELITHFAEVQLRCPSDVCAMRERAVRWQLPTCPHVDTRREAAGPDIVLDYEPSVRPDVVVYTDVEDPWTATEAVVLLARRLHHAASLTRKEALR